MAHLYVLVRLNGAQITWQLGQVIICSIIAQNHSSSLQEEFISQEKLPKSEICKAELISDIETDI